MGLSLKPSPFAPKTFPTLPMVAGVRAAFTRVEGYPGEARPQKLLLLAFDEGTTAGGVFTRSSTRSDDVDWCRKALETSEGFARALVVNSGNSNAFTGRAGEAKNAATRAAVSEALGVPESHIYLAATGVIGEPMPAQLVADQVPGLALDLSVPDWGVAARAITTTDTFPKGAGAQIEADGETISIAGIAKGSGMIAPNMATMLAYVVTDAKIAPDLCQSLVRELADSTFNCVTVDSDTSTSDSLMLFATGAASGREIETDADRRYPALKAALHGAFQDLARQLVKDGEGATKFVEITVTGAADARSAKALAVSVANSPLVKTALAASDANWGRIVMALGKAEEPLDRDYLSIWFGDCRVAYQGARDPDYSEDEVSAIVARPEISIRCDVGKGDGEATVWTCDLTHGYVDINGAYRT